ncbi:MAG: hypothetical protein OEW83_22220 [Acidimicrobiia bacterium]|jgi:hypothetical protein|nr:hypothetical protein [Acidimicrobiia bacterium]
MIDRAEIEAVAGQFGAPDTQIIRDHLISHILAAIADWPDRDHLTFFGGTALWPQKVFRPTERHKSDL